MPNKSLAHYSGDAAGGVWEISDIIQLLDDWQARQEAEKREARMAGILGSSLPHASAQRKFH